MSDAVAIADKHSKRMVRYLGNKSSFHPKDLLVGLIQEDRHLIMVGFQYRASLRCSAHIVEEHAIRLNIFPAR
jgi:hypothetical protein